MKRNALVLVLLGLVLMFGGRTYADLAASDVSLTVSSFEYDGSDYAGENLGCGWDVSVEDAEILNGSLECKVVGKGSESKAEDAGRYDVRVVVEGGSYGGQEITLGEAFAIEPREITWKSVAIEEREYDGTLDAVVTAFEIESELSDGDAGVIWEGCSAVFESADAGPNKTVTVTCVDGAPTVGNNNYQMPGRAPPVATGTITPVTITDKGEFERFFRLTNSAVFDGDIRTASAELRLVPNTNTAYTGAGGLTFAYNCENANSWSTVGCADAGSHGLRVSMEEGNNFAAFSDLELDAFIITNPTPAKDRFTVTLNINSLTYDGQPRTVTVSNPPQGITIAANSLKYYDEEGAVLHGHPVDAGRYVVKIDFIAEPGSGYTDEIDFEVYDFEILPARIEVGNFTTFEAVTNLIYDGYEQPPMSTMPTLKSPLTVDGTNSSVSYRYVGLSPVSVSSYDDNTAPTDAGTYNVFAVIPGTAKNFVVNPQDGAEILLGNFEIGRKNVNVRLSGNAAHIEHTYSGTSLVPGDLLEGQLEISVDELIQGEGAVLGFSDANGTLEYAMAAGSAERDITISGLNLVGSGSTPANPDNYALVVPTNLKAVVNPKELMLKQTAKFEKVYDGTANVSENPATNVLGTLSLTYEGFVGSEGGMVTLSGTGASAKLQTGGNDDPNAGSEKDIVFTGTFGLQPNPGTLPGNYSFPNAGSVQNMKGSITKKELTVEGWRIEKVYDGNTLIGESGFGPIRFVGLVPGEVAEPSLRAGTAMYESAGSEDTSTEIPIEFHANFEFGVCNQGSLSAGESCARFDNYNIVRPVGVTGLITPNNSTRTFTIVYHANGGTGPVPMGGMQVRIGDSQTFAAQGDLGRLGYSFLGWNTTSDGFGEDIRPGVSVTFTQGHTSHANLTNNTITLYAKWVKNEYRIMYNVADGNGNGADDKMYALGDPVTLHSGTSFNKTNWRIIGWNTNWSTGDGYTGVFFPIGDSTTVSQMMIEHATVATPGVGTITLFAHYAPEVTMGVGQGMFADGTNANKILVPDQFGRIRNFPANPIRNGYSFGGWSGSDGSTYSGSSVFTNPVTLTALWTVVAEVTISFTVQDPTGYNMTTTTCRTGANGMILNSGCIPKSSDILVPGWIFDGWYDFYSGKV